MSEDINKLDEQQENELIIENLKKEILYAKAETENIRRRNIEEVKKAAKYAIDKFSEEIISVKDSLESGYKVSTDNVEDFKSGIELTLKQMEVVFNKFGINEVNPLNELFDPNKHQSISTKESEMPVNTVIEVLQKGYELNGRLIRPALVVVSNKTI